MIRSKRLLAVGLVAALGFAAAACGGDDDDSTATTAAETTETTAAASESTAGSATTEAGTDTTEAGTDTTEAGTATTAGGSDSSTPDGTTAPAVENPKVGLLYDVTGRGDRSFNDAAAAGLDAAKTSVGATGTESTPTSEAGDRSERLAGLVSSGQDYIIGVGFLWGPDIQASAVEHPDQKYGLIDEIAKDTKGTPDDPSDDEILTNVKSMTFAEEQGSFLIGVAAALKSESGKIGFIGGVETPLLKKFEAGYVAGAQAINPDIEVAVQYITQPPDFTGFNDPTKGKEIGAAMYADGADVVYAAAGGSTQGVVVAASEAGEPGTVWTIGVDSDLYELVDPALQPYVLTSMLKKVDVAVQSSIEDLANGDWTGGHTVFDLASGGVDYSTSGGFIDDITDQLDDYKQQIIDGEIEVPTTP